MKAGCLSTTEIHPVATQSPDSQGEAHDGNPTRYTFLLFFARTNSICLLFGIDERWLEGRLSRLPFVLQAGADQPADTAEVARVDDGHTIVLSDGEKIRLRGVHTLNGDIVSARQLSDKIAGQTVFIIDKDTLRDGRGRLAAFVHLPDSTDLAEYMLLGGFALVSLKYPCSRTSSYIEVEHRARRAGKGIWATLSFPTVPTLLRGWKLKKPTGDYLLLCFAIALAIRAIWSFFRAFAAKAGNMDPEPDENGSVNQAEVFKDRYWGYCFVCALWGFRGEKLGDHWLGTLIGLAEIMSYPVLILTSNYVIIGAWLALKTGVGFKAWVGDQKNIQ